VLLAATAAFATRPASRHWQPAPAARRSRGGSLRSPALRTLAAVLAAVGVVFGATEVGVTAAATRLGSINSAGPLLALWGLGSLVGGVVATRHGGGARTAGGLALILTALALGHAALAATTSSMLAIGTVLIVAGAAIAPAYATIYAIADQAAPAGTATEAFSWLSTAVVAGSAAGTAAAGTLAQSAGAVLVFALAGLAGTLAVTITLLWSRAIDRQGAIPPVTSCRPMVAVDQPTQPIPPGTAGPAARTQGQNPRTGWAVQSHPTVRPMSVVVLQVLAEHRRQMPATGDEQPVQDLPLELPTNRSDRKPLRGFVRSRISECQNRLPLARP
jgi:MFS family permease